MSVEYGGKTVFGASVGILMLETKFPRIFGDIGNARTWPFPVHYRVVKGASPDLVVRNNPRVLIDSFVEAAKDLVDLGCDGLTTNCGFLSLIQDEVSAAVPVPVVASSLMQIQLVQQLLPRNSRVGVITISKDNLTRKHMEAANAPIDTPIVGTDNGRAFTTGILDDQPSIDFEKCRLDLLDAARELVTSFENIGAIVLECTNMVPYASDIRKLTGLPVFSIYSFVTWFQQGLAPVQFPLDLRDPTINLIR